MKRTFANAAWLLLILLAAGCTSVSESRISRGIMEKLTLRGSSKTAVEDQPESELSTEQRAVNLVLAEGKTYESEGELDQAAAVYQRLLAKQPGHPTVAHRLAVVYTRQGMLNEAEGMWQVVMAAAPESAAVHCDLGYFHYLQDRWEQAEHHFQQALRIDSALPSAHANLGMLWARQGHTSEAYTAFRRAGCSHAQAENNLAFASLLEQRWQQSQQHYQQSMRHAPELAQAKSGMEIARKMIHRRPESLDGQYGPLPPTSAATAHIQPVAYSPREPEAAVPPWTANR